MLVSFLTISGLFQFRHHRFSHCQGLDSGHGAPWPLCPFAPLCQLTIIDLVNMF